ncbi:Aste57867_3424 [Aphanomyces stellatus]|uniref:Aste57867_3424 protein n=1 Tax=Aphanomyces stellatus TaxID=120398 RepID=A0A485KF50_9STRA|nr:hypothetical protein As57867_003414 [Aphanomyces stellatus]VFT80590.1 Aste57867_3424 [Aphanomyces stellatus]
MVMKPLPGLHPTPFRPASTLPPTQVQPPPPVVLHCVRCRSPFGLFRKKNSCCVCSDVVCSACSTHVDSISTVKHFRSCNTCTTKATSQTTVQDTRPHTTLAAPLFGVVSSARLPTEEDRNKVLAAVERFTAKAALESKELPQVGDDSNALRAHGGIGPILQSTSATHVYLLILAVVVVVLATVLVHERL